MSDKKDKYAGKYIDASNAYDLGRGQGLSREQLIPLLRPHTDQMLRLAQKIAGENGGLEPPDPPDPPGPIPGRREFLQIDGMGVFLWFLMYYWDSDTRPWIKERAAETVEFFASYKPDSLLFFAWMRNASADNAHFRPSCPYPTNSNGLFDLANIKHKYLRAVETWANICKAAGIDLQVCVNMARYCFMPFEAGRNINGVDHFYHPSAMPFQVQMIDAWINIIISVYGEIKQIRTLNEPGHGSHHSFHLIANWIRDSYKESLAIEKVPIQGFFVDESDSAAVLAPFLERHDCPKYNPSQPETLCPDGKIGGDLNGGSTSPADRLPVAIINHGYSILKDKATKEGQGSYIGSAWPRESSWWAGGDGGTRFKGEAQGHKIHELNDPAHPYILFAQGDGGQTQELVESIIADGVNAKRSCGYQLTFFEHLQGWPLKENCQVEVFHRDRFDGAAAGYDAGIVPE